MQGGVFYFEIGTKVKTKVATFKYQVMAVAVGLTCTWRK